MLLDVPDGSAAWDEEVFGPVVAVRSVPDFDAAFDAVNASRYGLHASVFTGLAGDRLRRGGPASRPVGSSSTRCRASAPTSCPTAASRTPASGREGPRFAIEELTVTRMAIIRPSTRRS